MIDPKELRIGNYVFNYEEVEYVTNIDLNGVSTNKEGYPNMDRIYPIPITPEWLERLGFEKIGVDKWRMGEDGIIVSFGSLCFNPNKTYTSWFITQEYWIDELDKYVSVIITDEFAYIHQFQNLIFALTGEELTITMP